MDKMEYLFEKAESLGFKYIAVDIKGTTDGEVWAYMSPPEKEDPGDNDWDFTIGKAKILGGIKLADYADKNFKEEYWDV